MATSLLSALLLFGAPALVNADRSGVEAAVHAIYQPYNRPNNPTAVWEYPVWSSEVTALIARWQRVMPEGEIDDLNDGDWLCLCQDWDARRFRVTIRSSALVRPGLANVAVRIDLGTGERRDARLVLRRQAGRWKIDDMIARDFPRGLKQALRETIGREEKDDSQRRRSQ